MKLHLIIGIFALFFICCAVAYVAFGPEIATAVKYPGEAVSGEPILAANGVKYFDLKVGTGATIPSRTTPIRVKYAGYLLNGSSFDQNDNALFERGLGGLIPGWTDGLAGIKVGGKRKLIIPAAQAYKNQPQPKIPAGSTLVFDIELLSVEPNAAAPSPGIQIGQ